MATTVNVREAKAYRSRLLKQAHAGEAITLAKAGKPCARLMPWPVLQPRRRPGRLAGRMGDGFFEPLPADELRAWNQD